MRNTYQLICGMEVHVELKTASKMFCGCKNDPFHAARPNIHTCPVCLGMPGGLPVPNRKAIEWTIQLGLALNCKINLFSKFDRKHYFYPDLPKGYQISQYDIPFCHDGYVETSEGRVRIHRIHLEEDTGKLLHTTVDGKKVSLVDFNRGGVPLVEVVTEPDIHSAKQAAEYGHKLHQIVRYLGISDAEMQKGSMRLEANVSLSTDGSLPNYKVEVKNINSFKFLEQAIEFEMQRQAEVLNAGETPIQETRGWDLTTNQTFSQRSKESAEDYRYFPDPDIPPIQLTEAQIEQLKKSIPELPETIVARWETEFGIEPRFSKFLFEDQQTAKQYEELFSTAKKENIGPNELAKEIVNGRLEFSDDLSAIITRYKSAHMTDSIDETELSAIITQVLAANPDAVEKYRAGKTQVLGFLLGQIASTLKKKLDMNSIRQKLIAALDASHS